MRMRTLVRIIVGAIALWLTTLIVGGPGDNGLWIDPLNDDTLGLVLTLLIVALIFGVVNATLGTIVRIVSFPFYILTLGLFGLIVNGFLIWVTAWISGLIGFGLMVGGFWWGVLGALVLAIISSILNALLGTRRKKLP